VLGPWAAFTWWDAFQNAVDGVRDTKTGMVVAMDTEGSAISAIDLFAD
jgi:hypothetical protein